MSVLSRRNGRKKARSSRIGFAFFWVLVLAFAYFIPLGPNWNTESHLYLTFSLVDHHSLNIDRYHVRLGDESYWHGHYYSDKAPGLSFLAIPAYAALRTAFPWMKGTGYRAYSHQRFAITRDTDYLRYAITYLMLIMPSAIFALLLWRFFTGITGNEPWSLFLTAVYSLGTIAWVYSTWLFSHQIAAILLFGAFLILYHKVARHNDRSAVEATLRSRESEASPARTSLRAALAGFLAGYAVISEYPTIVIAALLGVYLLVVARDKVRAGGAYVLGMLPPAALNVAYNVAAFGKPLAIGYSHVSSAMYHNNVHTGLLGFASPTSYGVQAPSLWSLWQITFGTYRGIFLVSPVLLLFFVGVAFMWKRRDLRPELWLCLGVVVLYFLVDASRGVDQNGWAGGWSVASRHLTPMLPFMVVPMAFGLSNKAFRLALAALGGLSIAFMFMIVAQGAQFTFADHNPLVNEMANNFFHGRMQFSWGSLLGQTGFRSLIPFLVLAGGLVVRIVWLFHNVPAKPIRDAHPTLELETAS